MYRIAKKERKMFLTEREQNVLYYLVQGYNNSEIGDELSISVHTVKAHLEAIYDKLGVRNRVQAAIKALTLKYIDSAKQTPLHESQTMFR